jgi:hypothetical protein
VSTSQAFVSDIRQSLIWRSSEHETRRGRVGWNEAQLDMADYTKGAK